MRLETATAADFTMHVGSAFGLRSGEGEIVLTLTEVTGDSRPFSLLFSGPALPPLPQNIYALTHPKIGPLEIFLVPISGDDASRVYEAVFA